MTIEELYDVNHRLLFILGASLPLLMKAVPESSREQQMKNWIIKAVENVVYNKEPLPELPR